MSDLNMEHFRELRELINERLEELRTPHRRDQIRRYPWLYGALGEVPSDVMFICENPSITAVARADVDTIDGRAPDIEAQWFGGRRNPAAKRFRVTLCELGLKEGRPDTRGGWHCYITNVVKEANVIGADQAALMPEERRQQARDWADVLRWEMEQVKPRHVFAVGGRPFVLLTLLQGERLFPEMPVHQIGHYSARSSDAHAIERMREPVQRVLARG